MCPIQYRYECQKNSPPRIPAGNTRNEIGMGTRILNTRMLNGLGAGITIPIPVGTHYKIIILLLSY